MARRQQVPWILGVVCLVATPLLLPRPLGATPPLPPPPETLGIGGAEPQVEVSTPYPGVRYIHELRRDPVVSLHVVTVDLTNPAVSLRVVPAGGEKVAEGAWPTTLLSVPDVAKREGFDLAVNGDYFQMDPSDVPAGDGGLGAVMGHGYRKGQRARVIGTAVTDGRQWATAPAGGTGKGSPTLMIDDQGRARIDRVTTVPAGVRQALSGFAYLVEDGRAGYPGGGGTERNAWTAVGLDRERKTLILVMADGLWDRRACGITMPEFVKEVARAGCYQAFNLDGGGSATLVMRDPAGTGEYRTLNRPTDGKARPVAEVLGITVRRDGGK